MARQADMPATQDKVLVVYATAADKAWQRELALVSGTTVEQVILASGFEAEHPEVAWRVSGVGIFGKRVKPDDMVKAGDRLEIYRALVFDPKESRRRRALHRQRQKQTGDKPRGRQRTV